MALVELEVYSLALTVCALAFGIWKARKNILRQRGHINRLQAENEELVLQHQRLDQEYAQAVAALTASHARAIAQLEQSYLSAKEERDKLHTIELRELRRTHLEALAEQAKQLAGGRVAIVPKEIRTDPKQ